MDRIRLLSQHDSLFQEAMAIYGDAFAADRRRSTAHQLAAMENDAYHFEALVQGGRMAGIMMYWRGPGFIYLEHFAIASSLRGGGLGAKALGLLLGEGIPVILEIDPVRDGRGHRLLSFFKNAGFAPNEYKHIRPPYTLGHTGRAMELLSCPGPLDMKAYNDFVFYLNNTVMEYSE